MSEYTSKEAVQFAFDGNVAEFRNAVNDILLDKVYDAVQIKKYDVSANFMADAETPEEE